MLNVVLYEPEIPPNTGNIIRLCANCAATLHLIHPLGFSLNTKQLRRAGLDYHEWARVKEYDALAQFIEQGQFNRLFACSSKATTRYCDVNYHDGDAFLFGPESRGLPSTVREQFDSQHQLTIPMVTAGRSLNLANSVSIILYEAWRQLDFIHQN